MQGAKRELLMRLVGPDVDNNVQKGDPRKKREALVKSKIKVRGRALTFT